MRIVNENTNYLISANFRTKQACNHPIKNKKINFLIFQSVPNLFPNVLQLKGQQLCFLKRKRFRWFSFCSNYCFSYKMWSHTHCWYIVHLSESLHTGTLLYIIPTIYQRIAHSREKENRTTLKQGFCNWNYEDPCLNYILDCILAIHTVGRAKAI